MPQYFWNTLPIYNLTYCLKSLSATRTETYTSGAGVEEIIIRQTLGNFQSPPTLERKYLHHLIQVFSTTKETEASNAIAKKNGQKIGLILVINFILQLVYYVLQAFLL